MPNYTFKNLNTGEVEEYTLRLSEYDKFKEDNTHLERYFTPAGCPGLGDGLRMSVPGVGRKDTTFEKYVIDRMKETIPGNTMSGHRSSGHNIKEW
jgi:hypothetical protein